MTTESQQRIGVKSGLRGWFAVLYDATTNEPIMSGPGSYETRAGAEAEARSWARDEGLPCDDFPVPSQETITEAARLAHEMNKRWCELHGDDSQPAWEAAPEWQRASAIDGVRAIAEGRVLSPESSHANWYALKAREGWVYGELKDPEKKTHPCMVHYEKLPPSQRVKDSFFWTVVKATLGL